MIKEIWGNGTNVIFKLNQEGFNNTWFAASKWTFSFDFTDECLQKNGYRRLNIEKCLEGK